MSCLTSDTTAILPVSTGVIILIFFIFTFCSWGIQFSVLLIVTWSAVVRFWFWFFPPWHLDLFLHFHTDYFGLWKCEFLQWVDLLFLNMVVLPVCFDLYVKHWPPGKSLSYISHWFPQQQCLYYFALWQWQWQNVLEYPVLVIDLLMWCTFLWSVLFQ